MKINQLSIEGVFLLEPKIFEDERGFFMESYNKKNFEDIIGYKVDFVQDNHSLSLKNVLRGLHYQKKHAQGKLIRVLQGEIFDVGVDIRPKSKTFGSWVKTLLSAENKKQLWLPAGMAHGFYVLSEKAVVLYKTTDYYIQNDEGCIIWNDSQLSISWPLSEKYPITSEKDKKGLTFSMLKNTF